MVLVSDWKQKAVNSMLDSLNYSKNVPLIINCAKTKAQFDINPSYPGQNLEALTVGVFSVKVVVFSLNVAVVYRF